MQSYGNYPYHGQPIYQQPQPMNAGPSTGYPTGYSAPTGYPAFTYPSNPNHFIPAPQPHDPVVPFVPPAHGTATPRPKSHRRMATIPASSAPYPLKSAMKRSATSQDDHASKQTQIGTQHVDQLARSRTYSNGNIAPIPGTNPDFRPLHMFMLFIGNNELRLENIMKPAMEELRQSILPMWPDGIDSDSQQGHDWTVKFRNSPWAMDGPSVRIAWKIIIELFTLFARRGFAFQTSINTGNPPPRLIFEVASQDFTSEFFLAYFSGGGRRLTLINPPATLDISIGAHLKLVLPRKITTNEVMQENLRVIEVKKRNTFGAPEVEHALFLMHVLKIISDLGFELVTAVPLGRRGPLGVRAGRELLVFKSSAR